MCRDVPRDAARCRAMLRERKRAYGPRRSFEGVVHVADWFATFAVLAGIDDPSDPDAVQQGLPDIDSINMWPYLTGETGLLPRGNAWPRSVQAAAGKEGLELAGHKREDLGESSYVPARCSYSRRSGEALFNANRVFITSRLSSWARSRSRC